MPGNIDVPMMMARIRPLPGKRSRARAYAPRMPNSSVSTVVTEDTMIEFSRA